MLKGMITSPTILIHEKYQTPYSLKNCLRIIFAGNDDRLIHADGDERRYCVLDVSPTHKQDHAYFAALATWRDNGGLPALLDFLQSYRHDINLREVPKTRALMDHKISSLDDFGKWWLDKLHDGNILGEKIAWTTWMLAADVQHDFLTSTGQFANRSSVTQFGMAFAKHVPGLQRRKTSAGNSYRLPPLAECRRAFEQRFGGPIDWPAELAVVGGRAAAE